MSDGPPGITSRAPAGAVACHTLILPCPTQARPNSSSPMDGCVRIVQTRRHPSSPTT